MRVLKCKRPIYPQVPHGSAVNLQVAGLFVSLSNRPNCRERWLHAPKKVAEITRNRLILTHSHHHNIHDYALPSHHKKRALPTAGRLLGWGNIWEFITGQARRVRPAKGMLFEASLGSFFWRPPGYLQKAPLVTPEGAPC